MTVKVSKKKRRRFMLRRKRTLDPSIAIDFKKPDMLKRFITDRGKIIPRRISGATSSQQREITLAIKRARYLSLLPYSVNHRPERGFSGEMSAINSGTGMRDGRPGGRPSFGDRGDRGGRGDFGDRGDRGGRGDFGDRGGRDFGDDNDFGQDQED